MQLAKGTVPALWKGVLAIERTPFCAPSQPVRVMSARTQGGRRAVITQVPYSLVAHLFRVEDDDVVFVYGELYGDPNDAHLQFYERASQREFFFHPEQLVAA